MVFTDEMIRRMSDDREREKEINRLMICRANYSSGVPNGIHELKDLSYCLGRMKMVSDIRCFVIEMITKEFGEGDDLK